MTGGALAAALWSALGLLGLVALAVVLVLLLRAFRSRRLEPLERWHTDHVTDELRAADYAARPPLDELMERERRLVRAVEARMAGPRTAPLDRYRADGPRAPGDRNLTFLLDHQRPAFGALLLHGLSDSPYLMRPLGEALHRRGATVLGLRLPGHGTAPGGLLSTRWQDWRAATEYGVAELRRRLAGRPLWIAGYSTGAALALHHTLEAVRRGQPLPAGLFLMAPAIELPLEARFALWHRTLAWLPYFAKFCWQEIHPEQDPCKYGSFPKRAGAELYRLVRRNDALAAALGPRHQRALPPILACQSLADDTVVAAGIATMLRRIGRAGDELTVFDLNRAPELAGRLRSDDELTFAGSGFAAGGAAPYSTTLVTNQGTGSAAVEAWTWPAGSSELGAAAAGERRPLADSWPPEVFSLSHLALPMPADDPLYGAGSELGAAAPRGERGVLVRPLETHLRLRWNPFFGYMLRRLEEQLPGSG